MVKSTNSNFNKINKSQIKPASYVSYINDKTINTVSSPQKDTIVISGNSDIDKQPVKVNYSSLKRHKVYLEINEKLGK